jgi:glycosyltransferase involved in cell wall biosynthesis
VKKTMADKIRDVPETAVRLFLGAKAEPEGDHYTIELDGKTAAISTDVYEDAQGVVRALMVRQREIVYASDVLELRHDAEELYLDEIFGMKGMTKILFVPAGSSASGYLRAMIPADALMDSKVAVAHFTHRLDLTKALRYDVLWVQLIMSPILIDIVRKAKEEGVRIVYDLDDRLDAIPDWNQAKSIYGTEEMQARLREMLELADVVTASTWPLAQALGAHARDVRVLPNMITASIWPGRQPPDPKVTRILWAGSVSHKGDLDLVAPALREVLVRHQGKVRFMVWGERVPELLTDVSQYVDTKAPVDYEDYADALSSIGADFGIAPLVDNDFNRSKSAIKALEYGATGYPMLLSPVGEYPEVVSAGLPAELVPNDCWVDALERMIAMSSAERVKLGKAAQAWVCEHRCIVKKKAQAWLEVAGALVTSR